MKILILGGYGDAGILVAKLLLQHTSEKLIIAGRNLKRAETDVRKLRKEFKTERVSAL